MGVIYKTPPIEGEIRTIWMGEGLCYAAKVPPEYLDTEECAANEHSSEAIEEGVENGWDGNWNPWNPDQTWGLGRGAQCEEHVSVLNDLTEGYLKTRAVYHNGEWKCV